MEITPFIPLISRGILKRRALILDLKRSASSGDKPQPHKSG
jgi:hypothetical protein